MASQLHPAFVIISILSLSLLLLACEPDDATPSQPSPTVQPSIGAEETSGPTLQPTSVASENELTQALVIRVVDGDTIDVLIDGEKFRIRYIGIDTPETVDPRRPVGCFGVEASKQNHDLVDGMTVGLETDVSETGRFGRLLRYVWVGDEMVNAALVSEGYATASAYPPDVAYSDLFDDLQRQAREERLGLWETSARRQRQCGLRETANTRARPKR